MGSQLLVRVWQAVFLTSSLLPNALLLGKCVSFPSLQTNDPVDTALCVHSPDAQTRLLLRPCGLSPGTRRPVPWGLPWAGENAARLLAVVLQREAPLFLFLQNRTPIL